MLNTMNEDTHTHFSFEFDATKDTTSSQKKKRLCLFLSAQRSQACSTTKREHLNLFGRMSVLGGFGTARTLTLIASGAALKNTCLMYNAVFYIVKNKHEYLAALSQWTSKVTVFWLSSDSRSNLDQVR
jgi:hypothetical protein